MYPTVSYSRLGEGYFKESLIRSVTAMYFQCAFCRRIEIYICKERELWFALSAHVREGCDRKKSTIVLLHEERGVEVLY